MSDTAKKYIVLKGITEDNWMCSFFMFNDPTRDQSMRDGKQIYKVLGRVDSVHDAQVLLYGRCHSTCMHGPSWPGNCRD